MDPATRCDIVADLDRFDREVTPWLSASSPVNQIVATIIAQRVEQIVPTEPNALWVKILTAGAVVGLAVQTPPRGLLTTSMPPEAVASLVTTMLDTRPDIPAANGPKETVDRFCAMWSVRTGCSATVAFESRLHEVTTVRHPEGVAGRRREATMDDRDTVARWLLHFADTAVHGEAAGLRQLVDTYAARVEAGAPQWIWEVDGEPVSYAMESPPAARTVRVQAVYTPPEHRGNGYAAAHVAQISADILSREGIEHCTLYTDVSNPVSNGVYRRIGYQPVSDMVNYAFDYPN